MNGTEDAQLPSVRWTGSSVASLGLVLGSPDSWLFQFNLMIPSSPLTADRPLYYLFARPP